MNSPQMTQSTQENPLAAVASGLVDKHKRAQRKTRPATGSESYPPRRAAPNGYAQIYADVPRAQALSIVNGSDLHYSLYGHKQGRRTLPQIREEIDRIVMISPSHMKQCGIGEYGRYLSDELAKQVSEVRVVRTSSAVLDLGPEWLSGALVIVNHGPGLYDGLNPRLSQGESTTRLLQNLHRLRSEFGAHPLILHHSLLDTDHELLFSRQSQILNSDIPSLTFISSAGRHFFIPHLELGVSPVPVPEDNYDGDRDERPEVIGFFGFFQYGGKDFDSLFHLARELRAELVGSVATSNADELARFEETLEDLKLPHDFGSGWIKDTELLRRLMDADYFYLPQNDYDHWNNSATARFVTNLDRPLFLPPHHPFLDMADGSIFASREDLPRIAAHFRESGHYEQAVGRVKAFRERAAMAHTAKAIRTSLVSRLSEVGKGLFETPPVCSLERMMELPQDRHAGFARALGADPDVPESFPSLWRAVEPRQFWRKHYEIGDLVHGTALETIHAAFFALAKRPPDLSEIQRLMAETLQPGGGAWSSEAVAGAAIKQAIAAKPDTFHDPELQPMELGSPCDWSRLTDPEAISGFLKTKAYRRSLIASQLEAPGPQPKITSLLDLLLIPADTLRLRSAPFDLEGLDLNWIQQPRQLSVRMDRLVEQADKAGLRLGEHLVFDLPIAAEIEPAVFAYVMEDFIYHDGDMFLLNAIRRIDKRDPFAIEMIALSTMLSALGKPAVLAHLLHRAEGRVGITNFDPKRDVEEDSRMMARYMAAARDPLSGLIDARNAYEVAKRHNTRWWLANKRDCDALWTASQGKPEYLSLLYAFLSEVPSDRSDPMRRRLNPVWQMDAEGHFLPPVETDEDAFDIRPGETYLFRPDLADQLGRALIGCHRVEPQGIWTNGKTGRLLMRLDEDMTPGAILRVEMGFCGSQRFKEPREVTLWLAPAETMEMPLLQTEGQGTRSLGTVRHKVFTDQPTDMDLTLEHVLPAGLYVLHIGIDRAAVPAELGLSADPRQLGVLIRALEVIPAAVREEETRAGAPQVPEGPAEASLAGAKRDAA